MFQKVGNYFRETKQELNKVTWPARNEVWQSTLVVIFATFVVAAFIGIVDLGLSLISRVLFG